MVRFYLVSTASERAALHGTGVVVSGVVELDVRGGRVQTVEDWRQATSQSEEPVSGVVESHAHAALVLSLIHI